ncbi:glycogen synthase [Halalkalibacter nanhaiisediminis]|uniref:Glycogen synthase n=1 Tax=Halalkalibacter nanhaiisediminis TaxID=688079 RepID=A0A562QJ21_9BACI|nr:glycogen/starch synthase [Halalkalibacter nanhaiisediminis]TWI56170.1 starch synthase [Halalkalibacter nanhaiisediminis]
MNIVMVASECTPFFKTGGLADVIGSLPRFLTNRGHKLSVFLPKHSSLSPEITDQLQFIGSFDVWVRWRKQYCGLFVYQLEDVRYYFIDNEYYFKRASLYGEFDDAERYTFFSHAIFSALDYINLKPDILHCHDWQTGLIPAYIRTNPDLNDIKTVFTIHNLKYQGIFPLSIFDELLHFDSIHHAGLEMNGAINFMKTALVHSDWVTTVSPTYASEMMSSHYGEGLEQLLLQRETSITGIVNGIDEDIYHPSTDLHIPITYYQQPERKSENKYYMQKELDLPVDRHIPMFILISRLVEEKGLSLLLSILDHLLTTESIQVVIMGTGEQYFEEAFQSVSNRHPSAFRFIGEFNEGLARRLYAASDFFLMPSRFEPCGLSQLIALRYESVPIVRETGGLKDTIQSFNEYTKEGNGFTFTNYNVNDLWHTIHYAISQYHHPDNWQKILENVYESKLSWHDSAIEYEHVYSHLSSANNEEDEYDTDRRESGTITEREADLIIR